MTSKGSVTIPYVRDTSEALRRLFNKKGITVHFKPINTLRQQLVNRKDKLDKHKQSVTVYFIRCEGCPASYVGETERNLGQRLAEHRRPSCTTSPVVLHAQSTHHTVDWNSGQILDKSDNWFERGVREAIQINIRKSSLNRDGGRYNLPGIYNHLLKSQPPTTNSPVPTRQH